MSGRENRADYTAHTSVTAGSKLPCTDARLLLSYKSSYVVNMATDYTLRRSESYYIQL